jgi:D-alanyl-D-alanine carboxypeptidase (penicillin-binding protein 5/6)
VYRRRRIVVFGFLGIFLVAAMYISGALFAPVPATAAVTQHESTLAQPKVVLSWPAFGGSGITAPDYPGATEYHGSDAKMPIASVTKTITALVVLDKKPLKAGDDGPSITFTQKDVSIWKQVVAAGGTTTRSRSPPGHTARRMRSYRPPTPGSPPTSSPEATSTAPTASPLAASARRRT